MKKIYKVLLISSFVFIFGIATVQAQTQAAETSKIHIILPILDYAIEYETMEQIEKKADIIMKGKVLSSTNVLTREDWGYTVSKIEITEVFSGTKNVGDTIEIMEPYFVYADAFWGITMMQLDGYMPSEIDKEYIFFLRPYEGDWPELIGKYEMFNCLMGRYPVPDVSIQSRSKMINSVPSNEDLRINEKTDATTYRDVYDDVLNKYNK